MRIVNNLDAPGGSSGFQQELLALWQDPQVRSFVRKLAGDWDLIEDLWQAALCAAGTVKHPEHIDDRRAYFITVLKHEAYHLYALSRAIPMEIPDQHGALVCGPAPPGRSPIRPAPRCRRSPGSVGSTPSAPALRLWCPPAQTIPSSTVR